MIGAITAGLFSSDVAASTNSYESIATVSLSSSQSTIDFTSIPSTYKHLQIRGIAKASAAGNLRLQFNGDTSSIYSYHLLYGDGSAPAAGSSVSTTSCYAGYMSSTSNFSAFCIDILDYTNTNKNRTTRTLFGVDANGSGYAMLNSSGYYSTTTVSSIKLFCDFSGSTLSQYSHIALYGIKG